MRISRSNLNAHEHTCSPPPKKSVLRYLVLECFFETDIIVPYFRYCIVLYFR